MLKLRKVELLGFKSFFEKTPITFSGSGITCIVGPNGCGKSNVVDAISWVLGEQSHKMLRAERMSDCIFNGTAKRPPLGLAEVTLTLVDPELTEAVQKVLHAPEENPTESGIALVDAPAPVSVTNEDGFVEIVGKETESLPETIVMADAALFDNCVAVGAESHAHEKFLHVAQASDSPVD